jgi:Flp pilus assembly protein TadB
VIGLSIVAAMLAAGSIGGPRRDSCQRLVGLLLTTSAPTVASFRSRPTRSSTGRLRRVFLAAVILAAGVVAIGGAVGIAVGVAGAGVVAMVRPVANVPAINADDLAVVVDLVAGCLAAGASLPDALDAAAVAAEDTLRTACTGVAAELRAGTPPEEAWQSWLADPGLAPVARTAVRTMQTGAAAAADLQRTSARLRARRRAQAQQRVSQASVWLVVPLGLCFLPAFVLVAVVPLVIGLLPSLR